jgi:hypothetical protein
MAVFEQLVDGTNWKPSRQNEPPFGGFPGNWWMAPIGKMVVLAAAPNARLFCLTRQNIPP